MSSIRTTEENIAAEYELIDDAMLKYEQLIDEGKQLQSLPDEYRKDEFLVKGCQSKVWLVPQYQADRLTFFADSNTQITKGIVAVLLRVINGQLKKDILEYDFAIVERIGLRSMLSSQRSNGLISMIEKIKHYAAN